jgi:hypothetical protein
MKQHTYIAIDLKSFYASVECRERGLGPLDTNLVVADESRTDKIIYDDKGKAVGYIAPPATYFGKPKMPPKAPVRNY